MPDSNFDDVGEFHHKFGLPSVNSGGSGPRMVTKELLDFRKKFLHEELKEFEEGVQEGDHAKMFDSLIDLVYVAMGTAHLFGYPWQAGWDEVQEANMAKVRAKRDGSDSLRGTGYDVVKPEGWIAPDITALLRAIGYSAPRICTICHDGIFAWAELYKINSTPGFEQYAHYSCAKKEELL